VKMGVLGLGEGVRVVVGAGRGVVGRSNKTLLARGVVVVGGGHGESLAGPTKLCPHCMFCVRLTHPPPESISAKGAVNGKSRIEGTSTVM